MERLLNLLNEYDPYIASDGEHKDNIWYYAYKWNSAVFGKSIWESVIISKKYQFIEWLIDTQKIDTFKLSEAWFDTMKVYEWTNYKTVNDGNTDKLIMLLSIQENPIELLITLLR